MTGLRMFWLAAAALLAATSSASAQTYPAQTVKIVVPFSAGSITDGLARILAEKLAPTVTRLRARSPKAFSSIR